MVKADLLQPSTVIVEISDVLKLARIADRDVDAASCASLHRSAVLAYFVHHEFDLEMISDLLVDRDAYIQAERMYEGDRWLIAEELDLTVDVIDDYRLLLRYEGVGR